jgi:hypothetical protein
MALDPLSARIRRIVCEVLQLEDPIRRLGSARLTASAGRPRGTGKPANKVNQMSTVKDCSVDDEFDFTMNPTDRVGDQVPLPDGTQLVWASDNEIAELTPSDDTLTCTVRVNGTGVANVTCRFDGDPSDVESIITAHGVVNCEAGKVSQAELSASDTRARTA